MTEDATVSRETRRALLAAVPDPALLQRFHDLLASTGVERGLIGPREADRLWTRHLANTAVVALPPTGLVPTGCDVADVGSGAGLPGLVWAIVRPDVTVTLIEPLLRRSTFLTEATRTLELTDRVQVVRARAEDLIGELSAEVVTARAVAPLDRLAGWTIPLVRRGGRVIALKGAAASQEVESARSRINRLGGTGVRVVAVEQEIGPPTTVVVIDVG